MYADCVRGRVLSVVRVFGSSCFVLGANSNCRRGRAGSRLLACRIVCGALLARNVTRSCSLTSPPGALQAPDRHGSVRSCQAAVGARGEAERRKVGVRVTFLHANYHCAALTRQTNPQSQRDSSLNVNSWSTEVWNCLMHLYVARANADSKDAEWYNQS